MLYDFKNINSKKIFFDKFKSTKFDYVIIGTGPAGYVLSSELQKKFKQKKILVLERGNLQKKIPEKINTKYSSIKKGSRVFSLGGTANVWAGISSYLENFEMKDRWHKNKNLWPLDYKELKKNYKNLDKRYGFYFDYQENIIKEPKKNDLYRRRFFAKKNPFRFNKLDNYKNVELALNAKVEFIDEGKNQNYIYIADEKIIICSKKILVCCGGIESTKLLLRSLKNLKLRRLKNKKNVGRFFMDHPKTSLGKIKFPDKKKIYDIVIKKIRNHYTYVGLSLNPEVQKNKKLLNSYIRFEKFFFNDSMHALKTNIKRCQKNILNVFVFAEIFSHIFYLGLYLFLKLFKKEYFLETYIINLYTEMLPRYDNKIELNYKNKKEIVKINYKMSKKETNTINLLKTEVLKNFSKNFKLENKKIIKDYSVKYNFKDSSHHMGGTIYSSNKKLRIVDKNLKINGVKNIYICSSSIFPTSGSVNPTMTICALALRLSKVI